MTDPHTNLNNVNVPVTGPVPVQMINTRLSHGNAHGHTHGYTTRSSSTSTSTTPRVSNTTTPRTNSPRLSASGTVGVPNEADVIGTGNVSLSPVLVHHMSHGHPGVDVQLNGGTEVLDVLEWEVTTFELKLRTSSNLMVGFSLMDHYLSTSQELTKKDYLLVVIRETSTAKLGACFWLIEGEVERLYKSFDRNRFSLAETCLNSFMNLSFLDLNRYPHHKKSKMNSIFFVFNFKDESDNLLVSIETPSYFSSFKKIPLELLLAIPISASSLIIDLYSIHKKSRSFEANLQIQLKQVPLGKPAEIWLPFRVLEPTSGEVNVKVLINYKDLHNRGVFVVPSPQLKFKQTSKFSIKKAEESLNNHQRDYIAVNGGDIYLSLTWYPLISQWQSSLEITVLKGKNFVAKENGTCSAWVSVFVGTKKDNKENKRTPVVSKTLNPIWEKQNRFIFYDIENNATPVLTIQAYHASGSSNEKLGRCQYHADELRDFEVRRVEWKKLHYFPRIAQVMHTKEPGKKLAREGYSANLPIFLVPGFASTALEIKDTPNSNWKNERIWLSLTNLVLSSWTPLGGDDRLKSLKQRHKSEGKLSTIFQNSFSESPSGFGRSLSLKRSNDAISKNNNDGPTKVPSLTGITQNTDSEPAPTSRRRTSSLFSKKSKSLSWTASEKSIVRKDIRKTQQEIVFSPSQSFKKDLSPNPSPVPTHKSPNPSPIPLRNSISPNPSPVPTQKSPNPSPIPLRNSSNPSPIPSKTTTPNTSRNPSPNNRNRSRSDAFLKTVEEPKKSRKSFEFKEIRFSERVLVHKPDEPNKEEQISDMKEHHNHNEVHDTEPHIEPITNELKSPKADITSPQDAISRRRIRRFTSEKIPVRSDSATYNIKKLSTTALNHDPVTIKIEQPKPQTLQAPLISKKKISIERTSFKFKHRSTPKSKALQKGYHTEEPSSNSIFDDSPNINESTPLLLIDVENGPVLPMLSPHSLSDISESIVSLDDKPLTMSSPVALSSIVESPQKEPIHLKTSEKHFFHFHTPEIRKEEISKHDEDTQPHHVDSPASPTLHASEIPIKRHSSRRDPPVEKHSLSNSKQERTPFPLVRSNASVKFSSVRFSTKAGPAQHPTKTTDKEEEHFSFKNQWLRHMCLASDGVSDPEDGAIKVRPITTKDGCTYLQCGTFKNLSYVMGPLINNLEKLGYQDGYNMFPVPYDWRIPPHFLEQRDGYFTNLKSKIESVYEALQKPIVLIGHSMGNRILHYFFNFVLDKFGKDWIDKYIHTWMAVGAPWLGAPKALRAMISGERMGLEALLSRQDSVLFARRMGSSMFLFPIKEELYWNNFHEVGLKGKTFVYLKSKLNSKSQKNEENGNIEDYKAVPHDQLFTRFGCPEISHFFQEYYLQNPYFGGEDMAVLTPPPVKRLYNIYGVDMDTEKLYFYENKKGQYKLSKNCTVNVENHVQKEGIVYETKETIQLSLKNAGKKNFCCSGDGTVPYESLSYPNTHWKDKLEVRTAELKNVEHRDTISTEALFNIIVPYICKKENDTSLVSL